MDQEFAKQLIENIGTMQGSNGNTPPADPASLLAGQVSDPLMAAMLNCLMSRKSGGREERLEAEEYRAQLMRAKKLVTRLKRENEAVTQMLQYVSEVFGACPACWGLNRLCECKGQGGPGSSEPIVEDLLAWVEPVVNGLGFQLTRTDRAMSSSAGPAHRFGQKGERHE